MSRTLGAAVSGGADGDGLSITIPKTTPRPSRKEPGVKWRNPMWDRPAFQAPPPDPAAAPISRHVVVSVPDEPPTPAPARPKASKATGGNVPLDTGELERGVFVNRDGDRPTPTPRKRIDLPMDVIRDRYEKDPTLTVAALVREYGVSDGTMRARFKEAGIPIDPSRSGNGGGRGGRTTSAEPAPARRPRPRKLPINDHSRPIGPNPARVRNDHPRPIGPSLPTPAEVERADRAADALRKHAERAAAKAEKQRDHASRFAQAEAQRQARRDREAATAAAVAAAASTGRPFTATSGPRIPDETRLTWINRYREGASVDEIARQYGKTPTTVRRIIDGAVAAGLVVKRDDRATRSGRSNATRINDPAFVQAVVERYLAPDKPSIKTIAVELGTGARQVTDALKVRRVDLRPAKAVDPADYAGELRRLMAVNDITAHAVRVWCAEEGRPCPKVGNPNALTVLAYVLEGPFEKPTS